MDGMMPARGTAGTAPSGAKGKEQAMGGKAVAATVHRAAWMAGEVPLAVVAVAVTFVIFLTTIITFVMGGVLSICGG